MILYDHTVPTFLILLTLLAALALGGFSFWKTLSKTRYTIGLIACYVLVLGLFCWCLLMPGRKDTVTLLRKPRFIVVLDTSASMALTPGTITPSRWDIAMKALDLPWTTLVGAECEIDVIPFSSEVLDKMSLVQSKGLKPEGASSFLRDSLKQIADRYEGLDVAGAVLLSDGRDTIEAFDDWANNAFPFPLDTVVLQTNDGWKEDVDLRIDDVHSPRRVTVDWTTEFKVMVSGRGTAGVPVPVRIYRNKQLIHEKPVLIPAEGGERELVFELEHPEMGVFDYVAEVLSLDGEENLEDNRYEMQVQVTDARNRILYVEGVPRWEYKFLKRALEGNKKITPLIFYSGADGKPRAGSQVGEMTTEMTESQLAQLKIVVLGNLDANTLNDTQVDHLIRFVENGGSLVFLGGTNAWAADGILATGLASILPVRSSKIEVLEAKKPFRVALTDTASTHPAFAGDPELWESIPPVLSIFQGVTPLPAAQVLVEAFTPQGPQPMVVSHRYGQGKVTAIFTDSLWRWQLSREGAASKPYARFWGQMISWLLPKEGDLTAGRVELSADRDRMYLGEKIELTAVIGDSDSGVMRSIITLPDDSETPLGMNLRQSSDGVAPSSHYGLSFNAQQPGLHKVTASWVAGGETRNSESISFFVKAFSPENVPQPVNEKVLKSIAQGSGGTYFLSLEDLDQALSELSVQAIEEETAEYRSLWQTPLMIGLMMMFLTISWVVRKSRNMP